jgi:DNA-binding response OmpR family regulator
MEVRVAMPQHTLDPSRSSASRWLADRVCSVVALPESTSAHTGAIAPDTSTHAPREPTASQDLVDLLLIEDNEHYAAALRNNLEIEGFAVAVAHDGVIGAMHVRECMPRLVILDLMLPGRDGYDVLREIRDEGLRTPIMLLTARKDESDKLRAFKLGADDYVTKPVSIHELAARIRALLRRVHPEQLSGSGSIRVGDIEIHPATRSVRRSGSEVDLRPKEYDLLLALLRQRGRIVSRAELLRDVWGYQADTVSRTVDTHIAALRQKIEVDPLNPAYVITVRSAGYLVRR